MHKWLDLLKLIGPLVLATVKPELAPLAGKITDAVHEAEQIKGASGADKLQHVQNIAATAAQAVNLAKGKTVVDESSLHESIQEGVNTVVAVTNLLHKKTTTP